MEQRCAGFDREPVTSLLGGPQAPDVESCSRPEAISALRTGMRPRMPYRCIDIASAEALLARRDLALA